MSEIKFIDLFAGIGGIRQGFEQACAKYGYSSKCVFTSEIKEAAIKILNQNHPNEIVSGDITKIDPESIPNFDVLLGGFPCQAFSSAGKRQGFNDTRGTLFFNVANILKTKKPKGFILENVEGLVNHDKASAPKDSKIGNTLRVILNTLNELGYKVCWKVLNAKDYGVPQNRKRIYIIGSLYSKPTLDNLETKKVLLKDVLLTGLPTSKTKFTNKLIKEYGLKNLPGRKCKDKRGGAGNIHSWDLELKGKLNARQKNLLNVMMTERRKKKWASIWGIDWMDGMPLSLDMIKSFINYDLLEKDLNYCVEKKYLKLEHPKKLIKDPNGATHREEDVTKPLGYNIVSGKMSFEVNEILDPNGIAPTLVAMDMNHLYVVDGDGIRPISLREGLSLFGYPEDFKFCIEEREGYDLLGNTVVVPVIEKVSERMLDCLKDKNYVN